MPANNAQTWKLAVCLFTNITTLDFQGPIEQIGFLSPQNVLSAASDPYHIDSKIAIEPVFLGPTSEPVKAFSGPNLVPTKSYDDVGAEEQFDILLVPGGPETGTSPANISPSVIAFLKRQAPGAKYVLSVCTGSWILAQAGLLRGKRATTNKSSFSRIAATKAEDVHWIPRARWTVDGNYWTSSGVTAGIDMTHAFLTHLVGEEVSRAIGGIVEVSVREAGDDEFASFYNLV
ncbi:hypothetical protein EIP91_009277 [Steccherinum ochraceum]|uniref:DJ-1/PfpI domain-containing protein n=1 Tax=Steccherinum ochraceum TaxID=92696 RepID=A0A4R0R4I4_9APHY|nr:hypothetical protein EIP91_009277 [Steccherinum ochraceum]